tara:strand:+ start:799 stop:1509 length:711 start_codon:yes stop_codon:yes gene_type:complete
MNFNILTLFPDMFPGPLNYSIQRKAISNKLFSVKTTDIRKFSTDKSKTVDDKPFGGGAGMILRPDILQNAFDYTKKKIKCEFLGIYLSPGGQKLTQNLVKKISLHKEVILICGRYEGVDQRFIENNSIQEISIGDYIISSGEIAAYVLIDACIRLIPKVLGNKNSLNNESFINFLLEYPQYTKPRNWNNMNVPKILTSGNHEKIKEWRQKKSIEKTKKIRPDLFNMYIDLINKEEK